MAERASWSPLVAVSLNDLADVLDRVKQLPLAEQPHPDVIARLERKVARG